ncbi:GMC family oxidoreductase N-terminal domain-containing protein [Sphingobium sp. SA2]|uniref:GMC family oxidoreductase n=1 Tax=Sphingobium sp. SA2 TaxID=1524832 RepID=UPI0028C082EC|nr:GMC oxidoreductase [Sphingobium sp. SA2]MDT7532488.1 GMC family oxidoreductase N-terminal domain-containing protein [Sphingobium sp. SA2]
MYDYIIIGGGSAGCVMANRLSADSDKAVCLIEAGPRDRNPFIHMPLGVGVIARTGWVNWNCETEVEPHLNNRRLYWPRGKTLGGSSSINAMVYIRGDRADYEGWGAAAGADWDWPRMRELFIALENNQAIHDEHHGNAGPLCVSNLGRVNPLTEDFVEAGVELHYPRNPDFNGVSQEGFGVYQVTQKDGQRFSTARAFLDPARSRKNLAIETNGLVERILFKDDYTAVATTADREGFGVAPSFLPRAIRGAWSYFLHHEGELTSNASEGGAFLKSDAGRERPNLQFHFLPAILRDHGRKTAFGYGMTVHVCDLLPKSRGRIGLKIADPTAHPRIEGNYLSHPDDVGVLLNGAKLARKLLHAPALARHLREEVRPGPAVQTDEALIDDIRARAETIYHPVGTCRMGSDSASVVDPAARVRGIDGLRVVDASIMPSIVSGNTNAPTMAIAENVAQMMIRP